MRALDAVLTTLTILTVALPLACGHPETPAPPLPAVFVLRVETVEVTPHKPGTSDPWDAPAAESDPGAGCKVLAAGGDVVLPRAGAVLSALCGLSSSPQRQRQASDPDLKVEIAAGTGAAYSTFVERDTARHSNMYEFVVPVAAIPPDGLRLSVWDDDGNLEPQLVGSTRILASELIETLRSARVRTLTFGGVPRLDVVVSSYVNAVAIKKTLSASSLPAGLGRPVRSGEVIDIRAVGSFTVGSWYDDSITPSGYPDEDARSYNLEPFRSEPHGCAVALIGRERTVLGIAIGAGKAFVSRFAGPIRVGLNDEDPGNNEGAVTYTLSLRPPTAGEWLAGALQ